MSIHVHVVNLLSIKLQRLRYMGHKSDFCLKYLYMYSENCIRQSPLGLNQLAVIQRWPEINVASNNTCFIYPLH